MVVKKVFKCNWFDIETVPCEKRSKEPYYRLSCDDSVSIIAKTDDGKIVLVRQYRPAIDSYSIEMPSGYMDSGESTFDAVAREFFEETGYTCRRIVKLGKLKIVPSRINNTVYVFFGDGASLSNACHHKNRETEIVLISKEKLKKEMLSGNYVETAGIAMFFLAEAKGYL